MRFFLLTAVVCLNAFARLHAQTVTIERVAAKRWRATYSLPQPATSLRFERPAGFFREREWTVVTPGYHLGRSGDWQVLTLDSIAVARKQIVVEFPEFTDNLPKEYEFFQSFTDGGVAIYTGHLNAIPTAGRDSSSVRSFRIVPPPGTHAVVRGRVTRGTAKFEDLIGDGTYVYIGTARPIVTPDVVAIVDPGMPAWLRALFAERLPQLFRGYATRFGAPLPWKPVVLFGFEDNGSSGRSSGGGTLTGLISMTLAGAEWRTESKAATEQAVHLIAHESAHLWNGQLVANESNAAGAWMHEGSADAAAGEMLLALGVIDSARYRVLREEAFNRCATSLAAGSVETAIARGAIRTVYDCGFVIATWASAAAKQANGTADLFALWRALIAGAKASHNKYDENAFFRALNTLGVLAATTNRMRAFVQTPDSIGIAVDGLTAAGIVVRDGKGQPPPAYQQDAARAAVIHLMQQACGRVNLAWSSPPRTGAIPACEPFAREMRLFQVHGLRIRDQGASLHDAVKAACASGGRIELGGEDATVLASVTCTRALAPRPRWFEVGR